MSNRTLVVHPRDGTTRFLSRIYRDIDATVIEHSVSQDHIRKEIERHDKVIIMGHGSGSGLLSIGQFGKVWPNIIDDSFADQLRERDNNIFIWCHADQYVRAHRLKGLSTGMFVSEASEADWNRLPFVTDEEIDESNDAFADIVGRFVDHDPKLIHAAVKYEYGQLAATNPVARFNNDRVYWRNKHPKPVYKPWMGRGKGGKLSLPPRDYSYEMPWF